MPPAAAATLEAVSDNNQCVCKSEIILHHVQDEKCTCKDFWEIVEENTNLKLRIAQLERELQTAQAQLSGKPNVDEYESLTIDGAKWKAFWWYKPNSWPIDVLGMSYGTCRQADSYCFGRLPPPLIEADTEILAKDSSGNMYRWKFNPANPTAHAAWLAFHDHIEAKVLNNEAWNPKVIVGIPPKQSQDSFMYRKQNGVASLLLDDDNCDCLSTLSMGHGMCGTTFETQYSQPNVYGVDVLYDNHCQPPLPGNQLYLYFKEQDVE